MGAPGAGLIQSEEREVMDKSTELEQAKKTQAKLAVLPLVPRAGKFPSNSDSHGIIGMDASQESNRSDAQSNEEELQANSTELPAPSKAPRLPVVGPSQLDARRQDRLQAITDFDRELEAEPVGLFDRLATFLSGWAMSFVVHSLILILLAVFSIRGLQTEEAVLTLGEPINEQLDTDAVDVDVKIDFSPLETAAANELENDVVSDLSDELTPELVASEDLDFDLPEMDTGLTTIAGSGLAKGVGNGGPVSEGGKKGVAGESAGFFGAYAEGTNFIFVIDCSGSMQGERWERAVYELERSIMDLGDDQNFCIVLYNRFTVIMGNEKRMALVPPNEENLDRAFTWLRQQSPSGGTYPRQALSLALTEQPDAIFLLSDGEIQDNSEAFLKANNISMAKGIGENRQIPVHTIALLSTFGQRSLKRISDGNEGTFTRVGR